MEGAAEFTFQVQNMVVSFAIAPSLYLALQGIEYSNGDTLVQVWTALLALQFVTASSKLAQGIDIPKSNHITC